MTTKTRWQQDDIDATLNQLRFDLHMMRVETSDWVEKDGSFFLEVGSERIGHKGMLCATKIKHWTDESAYAMTFNDERIDTLYGTKGNRIPSFVQYRLR